VIAKQFNDIKKSDVDALLQNSVPECRTMDYKTMLPESGSDRTREFLADVSSFANAAGGDILYGVRETQGVPVEIPGLKGIDVDGEILRLENIIRTGVQPRILGVQLKPVAGFSDGPVILARIPRNWMAPHVVVHGGTFRFYTRNSAGKHPMDITELRAAFALSDSIPERMRRFRDDRIAKIIAGETPVSLMRPAAYAVLHLLPLSAFADTRIVDTTAISTDRLLPVTTNLGARRRLNIDGVVVSVHRDGSTSYVQLFRSGVIEIVHMIGHPLRDALLIYPIEYEIEIIASLRRYLALLNELNIAPPVFVLTAMYGAKGYTIAGANWLHDQHPIDREILLLPDVQLNDYAEPPEDVMRVPFNVVWNAVDLPSSRNYDGENWRPNT